MHRVLIRVEEITDSIISLVVPSWNPDYVFKFPREDYTQITQDNSYYLADVNLEELDESKVILKNISEVLPSDYAQSINW